MMYMQPLQEQQGRGMGDLGIMSLGPPGAFDSLSVKEREIPILEQNELLKTCIIFGGKCQNTADLQRGKPGWVGRWADNLVSILLCTGDTDVCTHSSGTGGWVLRVLPSLCRV